MVKVASPRLKGSKEHDERSWSVSVAEPWDNGLQWSLIEEATPCGVDPNCQISSLTRRQAPTRVPTVVSLATRITDSAEFFICEDGPSATGKDFK